MEPSTLQDHLMVSMNVPDMDSLIDEDFEIGKATKIWKEGKQRRFCVQKKDDL